LKRGKLTMTKLNELSTAELERRRDLFLEIKQLQEQLDEEEMAAAFNYYSALKAIENCAGNVPTDEDIERATKYLGTLRAIENAE
jgi:hypothetical protein